MNRMYIYFFRSFQVLWTWVFKKTEKKRANTLRSFLRKMRHQLQARFRLVHDPNFTNPRPETLDERLARQAKRNRGKKGNKHFHKETIDMCTACGADRDIISERYLLETLFRLFVRMNPSVMGAVRDIVVSVMPFITYRREIPGLIVFCHTRRRYHVFCVVCAANAYRNGNRCTARGCKKFIRRSVEYDINNLVNMHSLEQYRAHAVLRPRV